MEILIYICGSIALLALAALFVFLMVFLNGTKGLLNSVSTSLQSLIGEISAIRGSLQGTIKNLEGVVGKMENTVDRLNGQLTQVEGIIESAKVVSQDVSRLATDATDVVHGAKNIVINVLGFVDTTQMQIQKPINEAAAILGALGTGIRTFRMKLGGSDEHGSHSHKDHDVSGHVSHGERYAPPARPAVADGAGTAFDAGRPVGPAATAQ